MAHQSQQAGAADATNDSINILQAARHLSRFKERSRKTTRDDHLPIITRASRVPRVMLLGDSMLERMTTTGHSPSFHTWPSEQMLSRTQLNHMNGDRGLEMRKTLHRISAVFNAGCGGDKIENVMYRLTGDGESSGDGESTKGEHEELFHGLLDTLSKRQTKVKLWVIHVGTNNLHKKNGLTDASVSAMRILLIALLHVSAPEAHVLVTALFYRKDIRNELVDEANAKLENLVEELAFQMSHVPTGTYDPGKRRDSVISQALSKSGNSLYDTPRPADSLDDAADGQPSDSDPTVAKCTLATSREYKAREDAEKSKLEASISRRDFQPEWRGPPKQLDHFDEQRKRNQYIHLQIPHDSKAPQIEFVPMPADFEQEQHLEDDVHLNLEGYQMWMKAVFPIVADMLSHTDDMRYSIEQDDDRRRFGEFTRLSKFGSEHKDRRLELTGRFA